MNLNPHLLPKVRSEALLQAVRFMPCELRLSTFLNIPCAPQNTVVPCHIPTIGKGAGTKVSDLFVAAGCRVCHDLLDRRDPRIRDIEALYPAAELDQIMRAMCATQSRWIGMGLIKVEGNEE